MYSVSAVQRSGGRKYKRNPNTEVLFAYVSMTVHAAEFLLPALESVSQNQ
jgi:hypothetical protein